MNIQLVVTTGNKHTNEDGGVVWDKNSVTARLQTTFSDKASSREGAINECLRQLRVQLETQLKQG
jgi:hypothetical protein